MTDYETIADKLHETVFQMLSAIRSHGVAPLPEDYVVFKQPEAENWIILLFFKDTALLNESTRDGTCFKIHDFMWYNFGRMDDFKELKLSIFFEEGSAPETDQASESVFQAAIDKLAALKAEVGQSQPEKCSICDHDFAGHHLAGFTQEGENHPTRGWMFCKEEDCACFRTWDLQSSAI